MMKNVYSSKLPDCPGFLTGEARKEWQRITPQLLKRGFNPVLDEAAIKIYCIAWGQHVEAESEIARLGRPGNKPEISRLKKISRQGFSQACKFLSEFGMEPSKYIPENVDNKAGEC
jgi:P27 family predicted phage terminase small subunit